MFIQLEIIRRFSAESCFDERKLSLPALLPHLECGRESGGLDTFYSEWGRLSPRPYRFSSLSLKLALSGIVQIEFTLKWRLLNGRDGLSAPDTLAGLYDLFL
jgi:hypothetical protein